MALVAEVRDGPQKGTLFQIVEGRTFGRLKADYLLRDENVSTTHCRVVKDERGQLVLIDLDSSNGLIVNSRVVKKVLLLQGVSFMLGNTTLRIKEISDAEAELLPTTRSWRSQLRRFFSQNAPALTPKQTPMEIFSPAVELEFVLGLQAEEKRLLSYGPRAAGFGNLDLDIADPEIPFLAFEIHPSLGGAGARLVNHSGFKVLLNKSPVTDAELKEGDLIQAGRTTIKISFL